MSQVATSDRSKLAQRLDKPKARVEALLKTFEWDWTKAVVASYEGRNGVPKNPGNCELLPMPGRLLFVTQQGVFRYEPASDQFTRYGGLTIENRTDFKLGPFTVAASGDLWTQVTFPDGRTETLLKVPAYDFSWQTTYALATPLPLPAGTRIECTAHFDNSAGNKNNPDPKKWVRWGDQTWEEMMIGFIDYVYTDPQSKPE